MPPGPGGSLPIGLQHRGCRFQARDQGTSAVSHPRPQEWIKAERRRPDQTPRGFLSWAADKLLPSGPRWGEPVPTMARNQLAMELPGTGGLLAYRVITEGGGVSAGQLPHRLRRLARTALCRPGCLGASGCPWICPRLSWLILNWMVRPFGIVAITLLLEVVLVTAASCLLCENC